MREILFRGKTAFGAWVHGDLIHRQVWKSKFEVIRSDDNGFDNYTEYEVATETIGQYTGLTDKNGKKIFEGDIVEGRCHSQWRHELQRCEVAYCRDGFEARHHVRCGGESRYYTYKVLFSKDVVVIGNVHDNPELLEV